MLNYRSVNIELHTLFWRLLNIDSDLFWDMFNAPGVLAITTLLVVLCVVDWLLHCFLWARCIHSKAPSAGGSECPAKLLDIACAMHSLL